MLGALVAPQSTGIGAPSVALPVVARSFGVPFSTTAWLLAVWGLGNALALPLVGRLAQRWGVRRAMTLGVVLLAGGSVLAAAAPSLPLVVLGRLVGGLGGGGALIAGYALVDGRLTGPDRTRALGLLAAFSGTASGTGTLLGGAVTQWLGWRWVMAVPALAVLALPAALRLAPGDRDRSVRLDLVGATLLALVGAATITLLQAHSTALPAPLVVALGAVAVLAAVGLAWHVHRAPDGFVPRDVVRALGLVPAGAAGLTLFAGYYAVLYAAPALLDESRGWNSLQVGAALLPAALCSIVAGRVVGEVTTPAGTWRTTAVLGLTVTAGLVLAALFPQSLLLVAAVALGTVGFAGAQVALIGLVPHLVAEHDRSPAEGLFSFLLYGGSSVGPAAVAGLSAVPVPVALAIVAVLPVAGTIISVTVRPGGTGRGRDVPRTGT